MNNVPKLRFSEFSGKWDEKLLKKLAKRITQKNKETSVIRALTNSAVDGIMDQRDYFDKDIANKNNLGGYFIVDRGDYVYNPRISKNAPVGPISKNKIGKGVMSPLYTVFRFNNINNGFYEQYFKSTHWYKYLRMVSNCGARHDRMSIANSDFEKMPLPYPKLKEQQKIADCLSSIDDLITAHTQKHEALKAHKKGLMQQLFPAEAETVPKLRFPEFRDAGEWEEMKLGEITDFSSGGTPSKSVPEYWRGDIPWISASSMHTTNINCSDNNITQFAVQEGARTTLKGTLLLLVRGSMLHKRIPVGITEVEVAYNQDVKALNLKMNILELFLLYLFISSEWRLLNSVTKTGIGAGKLDTADLKGFLVRFPTAKNEQQKIANCLSSIDTLITAQAKKIESLKAHKKGLMQQLFPATDGDCMDAGGRATQDAKAEENG